MLGQVQLRTHLYAVPDKNVKLEKSSMQASLIKRTQQVQELGKEF